MKKRLISAVLICILLASALIPAVHAAEPEKRLKDIIQKDIYGYESRYHFLYDTQNRLTGVEANAWGAEYTTKYIYDSQGRYIQYQSGGKTYDAYTYDGNGRLIRSSRRLGDGMHDEMVYYYDARGNLSYSISEMRSQDFSYGSTKTTYVCDAAGRITQEKTDYGTTYYYYTLDARNRVTARRAVQYDGKNNKLSDSTMVYDYDHYKPFVARYGKDDKSFIYLEILDSEGHVIWDLLSTGSTAYTGDLTVKTNTSGYVTSAEDDVYSWEFVLETVPSAPQQGSAMRIYGSDRYATAFEAADTLKAELGVSKFQNIIVACGTNFPDALSGTYLAAVKKAPILLTSGKNVRAVNSYIRENLASGGTVYLLGDSGVVPNGIGEDFRIKRLGGATRYDTNLLILKEAGVGSKDIIVCTGLNFADSLSASACGLPILLVKDGLLPAQKEFLKSVSGDFIIVGGKNAVNATVEKQLKSYGSVKRLAGNTRYDTSVLVAKEFFSNPTSAVLAYAQNFPDGLSGGPLAYALKAPLILTDNNKPNAAVSYATGLGIRSGYVLGGTGLISDKVVKNIFSASSVVKAQN